jgi:hypothetical protein
MRKKIIGLFVCMLILTIGFSLDVLAKQNNPPNIPSIPNGPSTGKANVAYLYTSFTTDPDGDEIYYFFDWGDGSNSGWIGPFNSGDSCSESHIWSVKGMYDIKVKAKDTYGAESPWADPLTVTIEYSLSDTKISICIGLIKDKAQSEISVDVTCIMVLYIQIQRGSIQPKILWRSNRISIGFAFKIGLIRNHFMCAIFFSVG